jgi:hypothetical protein
MDLSDLHRALQRSEARPLLADARLVRRVIKRHRRFPGVGLQVPHARCYALPREALLSIVDPEELGRAPSDVPDHVLLLPRPEPHDLARCAPAEVLADLWRYAFHARVHQEIDHLAAAGALTPARIRERIHRIGQTEFDEIRLVLRQDRLLLPPRDDLGTYAEFAALYLELTTFAPRLLAEIFPTLATPGAAAAALREDLDVDRLLAATRPEGAELPVPQTPAPARDEEEGEDDDGEDAAAARPRERFEDLALAGAARARGNTARSALLRARAGAASAAAADAEALARRLDRVLRPSGDAGEGAGIDVEAWTGVLLALVDRTAAGRGIFRRVEARLLYDVQRACLAGERAIGKVDVVGWALDRGRRPLARLLPATREIRVARELASASGKVPRVALSTAQRSLLSDLVADARRRADEALRAELGPPIEAALREVGFVPGNLPERAALAKVVDELLDQASAHGHLSLGQLRDAVSRNQIKMSDLSGPGELLGGDPLLRADRRLADSIDGVHRQGEIYLRALQKLSSLLFGTEVGRALTFYVLLPVGGAYVLPFATGLVITEMAHLFGIWEHHRELDLVPKPMELPAAGIRELWPLPVLAALIFGLLHSAAVRAAAWALVRALGFTLDAIFVRAPRWVLSRPVVIRLLQSRFVLALGRFLIKPAFLGALAGAVVEVGTRLRIHGRHHLLAHLPSDPLPVAGVVFVVSMVALNTRAGILVEEIVLDALARAFRRLQQQFLPGLVRLIAAFFRRITDAIDRAIYAVDERLRFREGQARGALAAKAALGVLWFGVAYVLRIYVNLLVEPSVNPIKHFPTVTVAAKIMLPVDRQLLHDIVHTLRPRVGLFLSGTVASLVVGALPGIAGFLVWELKENYKLYRTTRPETLRPAPIGHHGESMGGLLKPGLHSGTLPKLWAKLRRAARKGDGSADKHREAMREIAEAVERFVDRELSALLAGSERFEGAVHVARVRLASNRVRVELSRSSGGHHGAPGTGTCALSFEEQSGWLLAGVAEPGWIAALAGEERVLFENALAGLYHRAGVELVREQIEAALPATTRYDIADEGLVIWPAGWSTELVYDLDQKPTLRARVRGEPPAEAPPVLDRGALFFAEQPIPWKTWVEAWSGTAGSARVVKGASILPGKR